MVRTKKKPAKRKAPTPVQKQRAMIARATKRNAVKHEKFCQHYVLTGNGTESYQIGYATKSRPIKEVSAAAESWKLLRNPSTMARLSELRIAGHDHLMVSFEETLQEIGGLAMFDPKDMFDEDGRVLSTPEMPIVARKMIHEFKQYAVDSTNEEGDVTSGERGAVVQEAQVAEVVVGCTPDVVGAG